MYGPAVLGASTTTGAVVALPNTSGSEVAMVVTVACLTVGAVLTVVSVARIIAAKMFNA